MVPLTQTMRSHLGSEESEYAKHLKLKYIETRFCICIAKSWRHRRAQAHSQLMRKRTTDLHVYLVKNSNPPLGSRIKSLRSLVMCSMGGPSRGRCL